jgi:plasmid stabilization system protein ParE
MAELRWTREAEQWLKDILEYIARDNPDAAGKVLLVFTTRPNCCENSRSLARNRSEPEGEIRIVL